MSKSEDSNLRESFVIYLTFGRLGRKGMRRRTQARSCETHVAPGRPYVTINRAGMGLGRRVFYPRRPLPRKSF